MRSNSAIFDDFLLTSNELPLDICTKVGKVCFREVHTNFTRFVCLILRNICLMLLLPTELMLCDRVPFHLLHMVAGMWHDGATAVRY